MCSSLVKADSFKSFDILSSTPHLRYSIRCMLFLRRPADKKVHALLTERESMTFSYSAVGATRSAVPPGYGINHMRAFLGEGDAVRVRAIKALFSWKLLAVTGLELYPKSPPIKPLTNIALLSPHFGLWSLDFCRVIDAFEGQPENGGAILRSGFVYGTLPGHAFRGEEIFSIEWHLAREEVWYDIYSFSLPANFLIRLAGPRRTRTLRLRIAQRSRSCGLCMKHSGKQRNQKYQENQDGQDKVWQERNGFVGDFDAGIPSARKINGQAQPPAKMIERAV